MFTTRPEILGTFGVVASTHWLASATGMAVLEKGGNAFDAAVAMGFALQVVEPHLNGPGGDMPLLFWSEKERKLQVICGQGPAPAAATIPAFRALGLEIVPGTGLLPSCVPGAMDAWLLLLRDHGTMSLGEVLQPAIDFAGAGYPLIGHICDTIEGVKEIFRTEWKTSAAVYLPGGEVPKAGSLFRNPQLAETYRRLAREAEGARGSREDRVDAARRAFAQGFVAEAVDRFCRTQEVMDTSGRRHRGMITADDMAGWQATYEAPLTYDYHRWTVAKAGPWAQSPVFLQTLALLKGFDLAGMDPLGPDFAHTVVEAAKLAFADREAFYGDPAFVDVPMATLLGDDYNDARRRLIGERASLEIRPGEIAGRGNRIGSGGAAAASWAGIGEPTMRTGRNVDGDTCHIDVIDRWGNVVSATPSGGWLQSSPTVENLGFCLGTRAQMFWLEEGLPNSLAPGKRPRTTLSPSMAVRDNEILSFGTPGGDQQDQWQLTFLLNHAAYGMNLQESIDTPTWHTTAFVSSFYPRATGTELVVESRVDKEVIDELRRRGHEVTVADPWSLGRMSAISRTTSTGLLRAAANPRGMQGYAVGR